MISSLLALALAATPASSFQDAFPGAAVVKSPAGGRLVQASGFAAEGLGSTPDAAARAFLERYGAAFGIGGRQRLVLKRGVDAATPGPLRFERRIDGLPVFDADVVVGVDARGAVILVNATDTPAHVSGRHVLGPSAAVRAAHQAIPGLRHAGVPRAERGWRAALDAIRPVWRVDFTATDPSGEWRSFVDAETGKVLLRVDRRSSMLRVPAAQVAPGPSLPPRR